MFDPTDANADALGTGWRGAAAAFQPVVEAPAPVSDLVELAAKASSMDVELSSDEELLAAAAALENIADRTAAASARVLARLEHLASSDEHFGHRTGRWLSIVSNGSRSRCQARVRSASRLAEWFPMVEEALSAGELGWAHAEHLCRVANPRNRHDLSEAQTDLIELARQFSFEDWAILVTQLATDLDADGGYDPGADPEANRLRLRANGDGTQRLDGQLAGTAAATVPSTLGQIADEIFRRFRNDHELDPELPVPSRATLLALALEEACRRALAVDLGSSRAPGTEAVIVIHHGDEDIVTPDGDRPVPADRPGAEPQPRLEPQPSEPASLAGLTARTLAGAPVSLTTVDALLGGALLRALVVDSDDNPLHWGRTRRLATPSQQLAMAVRDGGCIFPGCDRPPDWCDAHHQPSWTDTGSTDTPTMALLCRHHHVVTHRDGWQMRPHPTRAERWCWNTPSGRTLRSQRRSDRSPPLRTPLPNRRTSPG